MYAAVCIFALAVRAVVCSDPVPEGEAVQVLERERQKWLSASAPTTSAPFLLREVDAEWPSNFPKSDGEPKDSK